MPARYQQEGNASEQCRLYNRVPVMSFKGRTVFYALLLSPSNSLYTERCTAAQVPNLIRGILNDEIFPDIVHGCERVLVCAPPCRQWLNLRRRYNPSTVILTIPPGHALTSDEYQNMVELAKVQMRFALNIEDLERLSVDFPELAAHVSYVLVDHNRRAEQMEVLDAFKQDAPGLKSIGYKKNSQTFSIADAVPYDLVMAVVTPAFYHYDPRPQWQHDILRTFAELFSEIYDIKDVTDMSVEYPVVGTAMKKLLSSQEILSFCQNGKLTQKDIRDLCCVALAFDLYCMSCRASLAHMLNRESSDIQMTEIGMEPFISALMRGKLVDLYASRPCDDYGNRQAFMAGLLSKTYIFLNDSYETVKDEFVLNAVSSYFSNDNTTLGKVIFFVRALSTQDHRKISDFMTKSEFNYSKDDIFTYYRTALIWTEAVRKALGI